LSKTRRTDGHHLVLWAAARHDLRTAIYLAKNPEMTVNNIGFHLQQAIEKALKALPGKLDDSTHARLLDQSIKTLGNA
jgi:hypothetical protein